MLVRLAIALILGGLIGFERQLVGKEAGIRTGMMVSGGAAIFAIIGLSLPYLIATPGTLNEILARNSGFLAVIANIVVGVGFLGAGVIIKTDGRVHGLTTAAVVWIAAAIGTLAGIGLIDFAIASAVILAGALYIFRKIGLLERIGPRHSKRQPAEAG